MPSVASRFQSKVVFKGGDHCWEWKPPPKKNGYGQIQVDGKMQLAHRVAYMLYKGDIPDGLLVCHRCDNRRCVNPDHLFLGTHTDNQNDSVSKGRRNCPKGESQWKSRFKEEDILAIRSDTRTQTEIARDYGVTQSQISKIKSRSTWKHI